MSQAYLTQASSILKKFNIKVKNISTKEDIQKSKGFNATLKPTLNKIVIK